MSFLNLFIFLNIHYYAFSTTVSPNSYFVSYVTL